MAKEKTFNELMKQLEKIVDQLEKEDVDLDESIKLYEEGLELSKKLKEQLKGYEKKVSELSKEDENDE